MVISEILNAIKKKKPDGILKQLERTGTISEFTKNRERCEKKKVDAIKKYLKGKESVPVENRIKMFRLVEKMAMESADTISDIHGGGSPEAHRVTIMRESDLESKKRAAKRLAGIDEEE